MSRERLRKAGETTEQREELIRDVTCSLSARANLVPAPRNQITAEARSSHNAMPLNIG